MAKVEFTRVETDEEVEDISIKDGQLIYSKSGKTYMDYGDERIPTGSGGSSVDVDTEMSDSSTNAVQNKVIKEYVDNQVIISDTEPTDPDNKIWIDTGEIAQQVSEITNTYNTSENLGYSCNYVNNRTNIFDLIRFENIVAEGSYTVAAGSAAYKGTTCPTIEGYTPWLCYEVLGQGNAALKGNTTIPNANNEIGCWVVNTTTSSVTVTGTVFKVMYIKEAS